MKKTLTFLLALIMLFGMIACGQSTATDSSSDTDTDTRTAISTTTVSIETSAGTDAKKLLIGYSSKTQTNDAFQIALASTVEAAVKAAGHECTVVQTDSGSNPAQQVSQIEDLINKGIDGLVLNVCDPTALIPVMEECKEAGIPVICVDGRLDASTNPELYLTYVGVNNLTAATSASKFTADHVGGEGDVIIIGGRSASLSSQDRVAGFYSGIEGTNMKVVAEQAGDYDNDTAMQVMENLLQVHAANVDVIFTASDVMLDGILQAIDNHGAVNPDVVIMSYDGSATACDYIAEGIILGSCAQFPKKIGTIAVEELLAVLNGEKTATDYADNKYIDSGTEVITKENLDDYLVNWAY